MNGEAAPSETGVGAGQRPARIAPPPLQRTTGTLRLAFRADGGRTRLETLYQEGAARARLPRAPHGAPPEAVLINTAGGLTGGDRMHVSVSLGGAAAAVLTTQANEKIYRAVDGEAEIANTLTLGPDAALDWLPQETILFDRARLSRRLSVEMAPSARLLALEAVIFGRTAMGEAVRRGLLSDSWRVRRGGRLVFADALRLDGPVAEILARPATFAGARAAATVLLAAPDAEARLDEARAALGAAGAASAWDGLLLARILAADGAALRAAVLALLAALRCGAPVPAAWRC